ncbi:ABC transporter substrate-binding protein [Salibacterium qingdaonense]|uniref:Thiamine pyrimidine synthase n=1 Tax=Salibacterium qingdaonense TaxID=266892 RepID=A0A1I4HVR5_9BACI|nr:ABC transporter substrate-binding protein [Salibacterium qingdaonense]SFL46279.1 NitT/TauT family transport system substrate-binding protein [Salibacterium qingdaonense]
MGKKQITSKMRWLPAGFVLLVTLAACGGGESEESGTAGAESEGTEEATLVLNWFPKSQMGGFYAAKSQGYFEENGLNVEIQPGGPEVSTIQMVAAGDAEFGLAHADQLLMARNQGMDLVALGASLQNSPQAFMYHADAGMDGFEDLNGRKVYVEAGIPYWEYLKSQYDLSGVEQLTYTGEYTQFMSDHQSVSQSFVTSEPYFMERQDVDVETTLISESGYDPYNVVLFVTRDYLENNEAMVENFMQAYRPGWNYYEDNYEEVNEVIHEANENIAPEELKFESEQQHDFVYGGAAEENGVGHMTTERWQELIDQLYELDLLDEQVEPEKVFTTEYLTE